MKVKDLIQLYHWQTNDYARHKASGDLYDKLNKNIDEFVEVYQNNSRVNMNNNSIKLSNMTDSKIDSLLSNFVKYLLGLDKILKKDPSLLNIRDEMLADVKQTQYLFSLH